MPSDVIFGNQNPSKLFGLRRLSKISGRDGSSLSPRKSEHILATKLGIIRILFYLHLTFFFELQSSLHDFPPTFHQTIWPDPFPAAENCNMARTWKDVLRHHSTSWQLRKICRFSCDSFWAEAQIIFLTGMWPGFNSFLFWHMEKVRAGDILTICHVFASVWLTPDFVHIFARSWGMAMYCFRHQT